MPFFIPAIGAAMAGAAKGGALAGLGTAAAKAGGLLGALGLGGDQEEEEARKLPPAQMVQHSSGPQQIIQALSRLGEYLPAFAYQGENFGISNDPEKLRLRRSLREQMQARMNPAEHAPQTVEVVTAAPVTAWPRPSPYLGWGLASQGGLYG